MAHPAFEKAFHPESIAIVGVSSRAQPSNRVALGVSVPDGITTLHNLLDIGFKGRLYPINPRADSILGQRAYPSVSSLPEIADLVIVTVPNEEVPNVLEDCVKAGALNVHVMSSGFGEMGQDGGKKLEQRVREIAMKGNLRLVGPNCVGYQVPSARITTLEVRPQMEGTAAFISQSGGYVVFMMEKLNQVEMGFSKMISFGNALVLDSTDFIEYLGSDSETEIITVYLEGVKDGRRFLEVVSRVNATKPVIIWKAGLSNSGARAAFSHTSSLGGSRQVWDAFFKQSKAIQVHSLDDLFDMIITFTYLKSVQGNAAAVLCMGGGNSVAAGDICEEAGMYTPSLSQTSREQLLHHISLVNRGVANPFDIYDSIARPQLMERILNTVVQDPAIDIIILNYSPILFEDNEANNEVIDQICNFARNNTRGKPVVFAADTLSGGGAVSPYLTGPLSRKLFRSGIPIYPSLARASRSISRFLRYKVSISSTP